MAHDSYKKSYASLAKSNDDRPYGKCYGQVCGQSYPCTQQEYEKPKSFSPDKKDYKRKKKGGGA